MNDGTCAANGANCDIAATQTGNCITCAPGFYQTNQDTSQTCTGFIPNCLRAVRIGSSDFANCELCAPGFYVNNDTPGTSCSRISPNCKITYRNGTCQQCQKDYYLLANGTCARNSPKCEIA